MNETQLGRHDLSREATCNVPTPGTTALGIDQPATTSGVLFGDGHRSYEPPLTSRISDTAQRVWDSTRHQAEDLASSVSHKTGDLMCQATGWIRRHPGTSLLCGFSLGFLVADAIIYLSSGRRR